MAKIDTFEQHAAEYDTWFERHKLEYALELKAIKALLPVTGVGIEIGAGTGRFTQALNISLGVESSAAMRKIALERGVNIINGAAEFLPIKNNSFRKFEFVQAMLASDMQDLLADVKLGHGEGSFVVLRTQRID